MIYCDIYDHICMGFLCSADNSEDKVECRHAKVRGNKDNKLKIMPEFGSSGIWDAHTGVMVDYKYLLLEDEELIAEFEKWINYYDDSYERDYSTLKEGKAEKLNKWGRELAKKLKDKLPVVGNGEWEIVYVGENEHGDLLEPEII